MMDVKANSTFSRYFDLFCAYVLQQVKVRLAYRFDFILSNTLRLFMVWVQVVTFQLIFDKVKAVNGWNFYEVLWVYGFSSAAIAITFPFSNGILMMPELVINGEFDGVLIRPVSPVFQIFTKEVREDWIVVALLRLGLLFYASWMAFNTWNIWLVLMCVAFFICALIINLAIFVVLGALAFWFYQIQPFYWLYLGNIYDLSYYPLTVYNKSLQYFLTFFLPLAFVSIVPVDAVLHKSDYADLALWTPIATLLTVLTARFVWMRGISRYESTGS